VQVLDFNTGIDFGAKGNLKEFGPVGFSSNPDDVSTWSAKPFVELNFRLPPLRRDLGITVQVFPFLPDGAPVTKQDCWVYVNGLLVHFCSVSAPSEIGFTVSREIGQPARQPPVFCAAERALAERAEAGRRSAQAGARLCQAERGAGIARGPQHRIRDLRGSHGETIATA